MSIIKPLGIPKIKALGLNNTNGIDNSLEKSLSIRYISCERKGILLNLRFEIAAKGLNSKEFRAYLNVFRGDVKQTVFNESVTSVVEINPNGKRLIEITVPMSFGDNEFYKTKKYYRASISIINDNVWALSEGFKIDLNKIAVTKIYSVEEDWTKAAKDLGINDPDLIKAMAYKETFMNPFFGDYPSTMYERHRFYELYKIKYGDQKADELYQKMPDLVNPDGGGYHESDFYRKDGTLDTEAYNNYKFGKVKKMMSVDNDIAIMSASYGTLQVLGEYCNYSNKTPTEFLNEVSKSEKFQIRAFVNFIKGDPAKKDVPKALNAHNWEEVARLYNGKYWYRYNKDYPGKLKKYYEEKPWKTNS